jgi:hypothetical protein
MGGSSGSRASSSGGPKAGSIDEVIARITGAVDRGAEGEKKRRVRIIARIRAGGRDDENSTAYYAYVDDERYIPSRNTSINTSIIEDGWSEKLSAGLRQIRLRPCHGLWGSWGWPPRPRLATLSSEEPPEWMAWMMRRHQVSY